MYGYWEPGVVFKNLDRAQAEQQLQIWGPGTYLIRPSSQKSCLSCTYRVGMGQVDAGRIGHLLLVKPNRQVNGWTTGTFGNEEEEKKNEKSINNGAWV